MINPIEYKLQGNDFKLLQFLKTVNNPISNRELSNALEISERTIRSCVKVLKEHEIITIKKVETTNQYFINDLALWHIKEETSRDKRAYEQKIKAWEKELFVLGDFNVELH